MTLVTERIPHVPSLALRGALTRVCTPCFLLVLRALVCVRSWVRSATPKPLNASSNLQEVVALSVIKAGPRLLLAVGHASGEIHVYDANSAEWVSRFKSMPNINTMAYAHRSVQWPGKGCVVLWVPCRNIAVEVGL